MFPTVRTIGWLARQRVEISMRIIALWAFAASPRLGFISLWGENGHRGCKLARHGGVYQIDGSRDSR